MTGAITVSLRDELSGETVDLSPTSGATVASIIDERVAAADHPRADFRGRALSFVVSDTADHAATPLPSDQSITESMSLTLNGPDAIDVIRRRDEWLATIESDNRAGLSITPSTHLALIERTGSRLDDVHRLRADLLTERQALIEAESASIASSAWRGRLLMTATTAAILIAIGVGGFFLIKAETSGTNAGRPGDAFRDRLDVGLGGREFAEDEAAAVEVFETTVVFGPDVAAEEFDRESDGPTVQDVSCGESGADAVEVPFDGLVPLFGCEVTGLAFEVPDGGGELFISATAQSADPIIWLLDDEGNQIAANDDNGNNLNSLMEQSVDGGTYELIVGNLGGEDVDVLVVIELV